MVKKIIEKVYAGLHESACKFPLRPDHLTPCIRDPPVGQAVNPQWVVAANGGVDYMHYPTSCPSAQNYRVPPTLCGDSPTAAGIVRGLWEFRTSAQRRSAKHDIKSLNETFLMSGWIGYPSFLQILTTRDRWQLLRALGYLSIWTTGQPPAKLCGKRPCRSAFSHGRCTMVGSFKGWWRGRFSESPLEYTTEIPL